MTFSWPKPKSACICMDANRWKLFVKRSRCEDMVYEMVFVAYRKLPLNVCEEDLGEGPLDELDSDDFSCACVFEGVRVTSATATCQTSEREELGNVIIAFNISCILPKCFIIL